MQRRICPQIEIRLLEAGFVPSLAVPKQPFFQFMERLCRRYAQLVDAKLGRSFQQLLLELLPIAVVPVHDAVAHSFLMRLIGHTIKSARP